MAITYLNYKTSNYIIATPFQPINHSPCASWRMFGRCAEAVSWFLQYYFCQPHDTVAAQAKKPDDDMLRLAQLF